MKKDISDKQYKIEFLSVLTLAIASVIFVLFTIIAKIMDI